MQRKQRSHTSTTFRVVLFGSMAFSASVSAQEFSYNGDTGPAYWYELSEDWGACSGSSGDALQSPIDIDHVRVDPSLERLELQTFPTSIDVFNNGHTIEQHYADTGSSIAFEGIQYNLQQFHFHTFSEHSISDTHGVMELHGVFQNSADGSYLVLSVLFKLGGKHNANPFIQTLIDAGLPAKEGDTTEGGVAIDFSDALTNLRKYYTYSGSLTTPPCTETVTWVILARPAFVTNDQYEAFRSILGNNFRPTQETNGRDIRATTKALSPSL